MREILDCTIAVRCWPPTSELLPYHRHERRNGDIRDRSQKPAHRREMQSLYRRTEPRRLSTGSIPKRGAAGTKGRAHDANASLVTRRPCSRKTRHSRKPFAGSALVRPMTRVTRMTRFRGPLRPPAAARTQKFWGLRAPPHRRPNRLNSLPSAVARLFIRQTARWGTPRARPFRNWEGVQVDQYQRRFLTGLSEPLEMPWPGQTGPRVRIPPSPLEPNRAQRMKSFADDPLTVVVGGAISAGLNSLVALGKRPGVFATARRFWIRRDIFRSEGHPGPCVVNLPKRILLSTTNA